MSNAIHRAPESVAHEPEAQAGGSRANASLARRAPSATHMGKRSNRQTRSPSTRQSAIEPLTPGHARVRVNVRRFGVGQGTVRQVSLSASGGSRSSFTMMVRLSSLGDRCISGAGAGSWLKRESARTAPLGNGLNGRCATTCAPAMPGSRPGEQKRAPPAAGPRKPSGGAAASAAALSLPLTGFLRPTHLRGLALRGEQLPGLGRGHLRKLLTDHRPRERLPVSRPSGTGEHSCSRPPDPGLACRDADRTASSPPPTSAWMRLTTPAITANTSTAIR